MFDSVVSNDTFDAVLDDHAVYLPRAKAPDPFISVLSPRASQTSERACMECPVQKLSICGALRNNELAMLSNSKHTVRYKHKEVLIDQDEPAESVDIVTEGVVRQYKTLADGRRQIVGFALPGDIAGLVIEDCNAYSAEALSNVSVCRFSRKAFAELLDVTPHLLKRLHAMIAHELSITQDHLMLLGHFSARQKLAAFLLHMRNRWRRVNGASVHVELPMPRQDIADYLGLTIETVSRTISLLARQKVIVVVPDGVRIIDIERLTRAAGE